MRLDKRNRPESVGWLAAVWRSHWIDVVRYTLMIVLLAAIARQLDPRLDALSLLRRWVGNGFRYLVAQVGADPERIAIDIKHEHFLKLAERREVALANGLLVSSTDDFVPAQIRHGDALLRAKVRLKGDLSDHWSDPEKWSFRVGMKGGGTLFGMKQFSIQHPGTRDYLSEWLLHRALRYEGLPALRYEFVEVVQNGKNLGIYALEEHFEKRLIENSRRREGPIIRFNEDLCWAEIAIGRVGTQATACEGSGSGSYLAADVDAFHTSDLLADPKQAELYVTALGLLERFRRGELSTSEVFDAPQLARYLAVLELMDAIHALHWRNARFYYNPVTTRLEPIAFDAGSEGQPTTPALASTLRSIYDTRDPHNYYYHLYWIDSLFADEDFYALYIAELERISQPDYLEVFLEDVGEDLDRSLKILNREFPAVTFDPRTLRDRQRFIRSWLEPPKALHAHWVSRSGDEVTVQVGNLQYLPIRVLGLSRDGVVHPPHGGRRVIEGRPAAKPVQYRGLVFSLPAENGDAGDDLAALRVAHRILGANKLRSGPIFPWPQADESPSERALARTPPNAETFAFTIVDPERREIRLRPGSWTIDRDLVVPPDHRFLAGPGTHLELRNGATILSFSPLEFTGTEASPLVIHSKVDPAVAGAGLVVMGADGLSLLEHVRFENLSAPAREGWGITGAVSFYESALSVTSCVFAGSRAEDALNVIRTSFSIEASIFRDSQSDALDVDFSDGVLANSSFVASGNDAVDASGSNLRIRRITVNRAGDKGLSAGENSRVRGADLRIRDVGVAVASKDLSEVTLSEVKIERAKVGFAAYEKKSEFGPGRITASGVSAELVDRLYLIERNSVLSLDGELVSDDAQGVAGQFYPES